MTDQVLIRNETSADASAIAEVTAAAFSSLAISNHTEQFIVAALRAARALTVSLVAEVDGRVVGHPQYYRRFGFQNVPGLVLEGVPQEVFFALSFDGHVPHGSVELHEGFKADGRQEGPSDAQARA